MAFNRVDGAWKIIKIGRLVMLLKALLTIISVFSASASYGAFVTYEAAGSDPASITGVRDAFRAAVGGGTTAGANGSFGGLRREINWDGIPATSADPNLLSADFFNVTSPRGAVFSTPGTGFLVSANAGSSSPVLFGYPNDFQVFSSQRLFTAVNSNITNVSFFLPGTSTAASINAFGLIFVDIETANSTLLEFFDESSALLYSRNGLVAGNQGLTFLGAIAGAGERISRVRITAGLNTITANGTLGNPNDDVVVMDDFIYAEPTAKTIPEPPIMVLLGCGLLAWRLMRSSRDMESFRNS
jgi:hypothetical protein